MHTHACTHAHTHTHTHTHTLCYISDHLLFNPTADGGAPGGDGDREEVDEDGPSDVEGGEEDGMSYSRMKTQQVGWAISCSGHFECVLLCIVLAALFAMYGVCTGVPPLWQE